MLRLSLTTLATVLSLFAFAPGARASDWVWPLQGEVITPYRNVDDPYAGGQHRGIDIAGPVGAPVVAATAGEVRFAGTAGSSGLTVSVRTDDGRFDTSYLHLSSIAVRAGARLAAGDRLGAVGTTGRRSAERPHLHFGVRDAASRHDYRDPLTLLPAPPVVRPEPSPRAAPSPEPVPPSPVAVPEPQPVPVGSPRRVPVGSPRRVPVGSPRRVPVGSPRRVPVGSPRRVPVGAPRRVPAGSPRRVPAGSPQGVPTGSPWPAPAGSPEHVPLGSPDHVPAGSPSQGPLGASRGVPESSVHAGSPVRSRARLLEVSRGHPHAGLPRSGRSGASGREPVAANGSAHPAGGPVAATGRSVRSSQPAPRAAGAPSHGPDLGWALACLGLLLAAGVLALGAKPDETAKRGAGRLAAIIRPLAGRG